MVTVFVDTAAWLALVNTSDQLHKIAQAELKQLHQKARLVTTDLILLELADALSWPQVRSKTIAFIDGIRMLNTVEVIPASENLLRDGWTLYKQRPDKEWGLTDCTSFVVMLQNNINIAFTSDHHFKQAGFTILMNQPD